jgi:uncharacterized protein (TIGR02270 family)
VVLMAFHPVRRTLVMRDVVEEHAEEAGFLWLLRDAAVTAPHYSLRDLAELDGRVEAHLDGLRIAGSLGWELCAEALAGGAGDVFVGAVLAFESGKDDRIALALDAGSSKPEMARPLVSALGWLSFPQAEMPLQKLLAAELPALRRIGIAAWAVHRQRPGPALTDALVGKDLALQARALRAVGELGLESSHPITRKSFSSPDAACRFWANWSAALLVGDTDAIPNLQGIAETKGPYQVRALGLAMRRLEPRKGKAWQAKLAEAPELLRLAVIGAGVLGDPELVPWLIAQMKLPPLARVAGEAFTMITGVDIALQSLDGSPPEKPAASSDGDEDLAADADANLPWPNPEAIERWWTGNQSDFTKGTRHLLGKPLTPDWLQQILRSGRQRQRAAAALELAIREPERGLYEVRAPGFRQQKLLSA